MGYIIFRSIRSDLIDETIRCVLQGLQFRSLIIDIELGPF